MATYTLIALVLSAAHVFTRWLLVAAAPVGWGLGLVTEVGVAAVAGLLLAVHAV